MISKEDHYNEIKFFTHNDIQYSINREFLKNELSWLYDHLDKIEHMNNYTIMVQDEINDQIVKEKYTQLWIYLRRLPYINLSTLEYNNRQIDKKYTLPSENASIIETFLKNTELVFTRKIYEDYSIVLDETVSTDWREYYEIIMYIFHLASTHIDEIEFDLFKF